MSIHTLERPQQRVSPVVKPKKVAKNDPFPYGWRYVTQKLPGGRQIEYQVALTKDDLLNPQEDVSQRTRHAQCRIDIFDILKNHYRHAQTIGVFYDLIMEWEIPNLAELAPDIVVIPNVKDKNVDRGRFEIKKEGTCPDLVIEIVSPNTASSDYLQKFEIYEKAGIKEYLLIDPHLKRVNPFFEIKGYRLDGQKYRWVKPDENGCLLSQTTQVWFCLVDNAQRLRLKDAKTGHWLLTASEQQQERLENEADVKQAKIRTEQEIKARKQAETEAKQEMKARKQAETQVKQEVKARKQAEIEAKQAKQEKELAQQQIAQLKEKFRQLGIDPDSHDQTGLNPL